MKNLYLKSLLTLCIAASPLYADGNAFSVGEKLDFKVYFEFILGGYSTMSVTSIDTIDGHPCYKLVSTAKSTKMVDTFYKVRDKVESWRDVEGGFTRLYGKHLREGSYESDKIVVYKPEEDMVILRHSSRPADTFRVKGYVQDVLSALYDVRNRKLEPGKSVFVDVHDIDKRYDLEVKVLKREKVKVPAGKFKCLVIEPLLQSSGIFRKEGQLQVWVTDDQRHMPVMMKSKLYFGAVYAKLIKYRQDDR